MFSRGELKREARNKLSGNWGIMILICLISSIFQYFTDDIGDTSMWLLLIGLIIMAPIELSISKITLNLCTGEESPRLSQLAYGFKNILKAVGLAFIMTISITIGILLFIIPGIIVELMFSQAIYVLADNPEISVMDALKESCILTKGYKGDIFILTLSFLGWLILGMLTFGIGLLWVIPYIEVTNAELYLFLKNKQFKIML